MGGISLPWVYVHSSIYETYLVQWCSLDLWSNWMKGNGGTVYHRGICAFCYMMKHIQCSGVAYIDGCNLRRGDTVGLGYMCINFYMQNISGVVVLHSFYGQVEEGDGVSMPWVYVHSSICRTY